MTFLNSIHSRGIYTALAIGATALGIREIKESHAASYVQHRFRKMLGKSVGETPTLHVKRAILGSSLCALGMMGAYSEGIAPALETLKKERPVFMKDLCPPLSQDKCQETEIWGCPSHIERMKCLQKEIDKKGYTSSVCLLPKRPEIPNTLDVAAAQRFKEQYQDPLDREVIQKAFDSLIQPTQEAFEEEIRLGAEELNTYLKTKGYPPYVIWAPRQYRLKSFDYVKDLAFRHLKTLPYDVTSKINRIFSDILHKVDQFVIFDDAAYSCTEMENRVAQFFQEAEFNNKAELFVVLPYAPSQRCFEFNKKNPNNTRVFASKSRITPSLGDIFDSNQVKRLFRIISQLERGSLEEGEFDARTFLKLPHMVADGVSFPRGLFLPRVKPQTHPGCFAPNETKLCHSLQDISPPYKQEGYCLS